MFFQRKPSSQEPWVYRFFGDSLGAAVLFVFEVFQIIVIAAAIIIPIRYFLIQPFIVKGASMEPNFFDSEYLIIDEVSYRFRDIERGEIVVFHPPSDDEKDYYIKRVIGLPGETVEVRDGEVIIYNDDHPDGIVLEEAYIHERTPHEDRVTLGIDEYYLLGDNRDASLDSRVFGGVPEENIVGRVWIRGLPVDRITTFDIPFYNV